jgi:hypothetical protein
MTFSDGAGPYDGTNGAVWKYDIGKSACKQRFFSAVSLA